MKGALETQMRLGGSIEMPVLKCTKQKDFDEFEDIRLVTVPVADSLVVLAATADAAPNAVVAEAQLTPKQKVVLGVLREEFPEGVSHGDWRDASLDRDVSNGTFNGAIPVLMDGGLAEQSHGIYRPILQSKESSDLRSKSNEACSGEVHRSTHPLGGGLVDSAASEMGEVDRDLEEAWEDSTDESR